jgi:hypothetical protein
VVEEGEVVIAHGGASTIPGQRTRRGDPEWGSSARGRDSLGHPELAECRLRFMVARCKSAVEASGYRPREEVRIAARTGKITLSNLDVRARLTSNDEKPRLEGFEGDREPGGSRGARDRLSTARGRSANQQQPRGSAPMPPIRFPQVTPRDVPTDAA